MIQLNYSIEELIDFLMEYAIKHNSTLNDYYTKEEVHKPYEKIEILEIPNRNTADIIIRIYNTGKKLLGICFLNSNKSIIGKNLNLLKSYDINTIPEYVMDFHGNFDIFHNLVGNYEGHNFRELINCQKDIKRKIEYFLDNYDDYINVK